ncbi:MAG: tetratricopeptide repeat protein [Gammaproteobacteria bacterium]|nr:tetratricopeptide repeat protein [Gammaproteobacteria bacterium]
MNPIMTREPTLAARRRCAGLAMALLVLLTAGCAAAPSPATTPSSTTQTSTPPSAQPPAAPPSPRPETPAASPAVTALSEQAAVASAAGDHDGAATLLERALRVEPRNAELWHALAMTRLQTDDAQQAEQLALRSNGLAGDRAELRRRNWLLIAEARSRRGDAAGSQLAREQALNIDAGR